eukprot:767934-Hanusia_phi.AAC.3
MYARQIARHYEEMSCSEREQRMEDDDDDNDDEFDDGDGDGVNGDEDREERRKGGREAGEGKTSWILPATMLERPRRRTLAALNNISSDNHQRKKAARYPTEEGRGRDLLSGVRNKRRWKMAYRSSTAIPRGAGG